MSSFTKYIYLHFVEHERVRLNRVDDDERTGCLQTDRKTHINIILLLLLLRKQSRIAQNACHMYRRVGARCKS